MGTDRRISLRFSAFCAVLDRTDWQYLVLLQQKSCSRQHSCRLPVLKPRSGHLNGHIDRRPVKNYPTHPHFFATDGSGTSCFGLVIGALSRHAISRIGFCTLRRSCLRVTEALAHCIRTLGAGTRWITTPWCVLNKSGKSDTQPPSCVEKPETFHSVEHRGTC